MLNILLNDYLSIHFLIYLGRWIISAVVMLPFIYLLVRYKCCESKYKEYIHLIIVQIIGSFIFFEIDKYIFTN